MNTYTFQTTDWDTTGTHRMHVDRVFGMESGLWLDRLTAEDRESVVRLYSGMQAAVGLFERYVSFDHDICICFFGDISSELCRNLKTRERGSGGLRHAKPYCKIVYCPILRQVMSSSKHDEA